MHPSHEAAIEIEAETILGENVSTFATTSTNPATAFYLYGAMGAGTEAEWTSTQAKTLFETLNLTRPGPDAVPNPLSPPPRHAVWWA